jgi:hypothetical protein
MVKSRRSAAKAAKAKDIFTVEAIVGKRMRNGKVHYHVKWKGYESADNTWEPIENLSGCRPLIT